MVATMLQSVNVSPAEIGTFYLAGGFGTHYDLESAITVGLYPDLPREKFRILGNSSLAGARRLLLDRSCRARLERIRALATYVQFGEMEKFVENMHAARFLPHTDRLPPTPAINAACKGSPRRGAGAKRLRGCRRFA